MIPFTEMEWNAKWDWENLVAFGSKAIAIENANENENKKLQQLADNWTMVDNGSSFKLTTSEEEGEGSCGIDLSGTSSSAEALLGLKLGKRTYFENSTAAAAAAAKIGSFPVVPTPPAPKKTKSSTRITSPIFCQVEGCNVHLSLAKEYHRKHRVCDSHSKSPKVVVGGHERRFCQQCSRFHSLSEFDEKKRSCRRRLSDHNARRRKPQQETIQFNSPRLSTPCYGADQQMSFLLDSSPLVRSRIPVNSSWNNSKFTLAKGYLLKSEGNGDFDEQLHMPGTTVPQATNMQNGLSASKNILNPDPGSKGSSVCSLDAAPEYRIRRALSLLSSNSWDSCNQESIQLHHQLHENGIQPIMYHAIPQGVPFSSSELWPTGPHPTTHQHHVQSLASLKAPYDGDFCSNLSTQG